MAHGDFESEVLQRLTRIETNQENINDNCGPCRTKLSELEIMAARVEASAKSAHHRIDTMQTINSDLKKDLMDAIKEQTDGIKEQISGIYRTAMIVGGMASFFVGLIMWAIDHWIK